MLDVGYHASVHLQLHVFGRGILLLVLVHRLKVLSDDRAVRNHIGRERVGECREEYAGNHVRAKQALERYSRCQHGDNLGIACQLGGEHDDRYEHEQRTEEVGEVWHEVGIVIEDDSSCRCMILGKLRQVVVEVEHDGNGDDERYREEVVAYELLDDISVQSFDVSQWVEILEYLEESQFMPNPSHDFSHPAQFSAQPSEGSGEPSESSSHGSAEL